jgi:CRISPR type I-E-associated protein CasB/Cse2
VSDNRYAWWGDQNAADALRSFHRELHDEAADKSSRAALRRARTPQEAALVPIVGVLRRTIRREGIKISDDDIDTAAILAAAIERDQQVSEISADPNVKDVGPRGFTPLGRQLAERLAERNSNGKRVSPERVRLLLSTENIAEFLRLLRSLIDLLDRKAPVVAIVETARRWSRPAQRQQTRAAIARPYYERIAQEKDSQR